MNCSYILSLTVDGKEIKHEYRDADFVLLGPCNGEYKVFNNDTDEVEITFSNRVFNYFDKQYYMEVDFKPTDFKKYLESTQDIHSEKELENERN